MGKFEEMLTQQLGGAMSGVSGLVGQGISEIFGINDGAAKAQLSQQQKLIDMQQKANWATMDRVNAYNAPSAQVERLKAAGLNPALMYGGGGGGGTTAAQAVGSANAGQASDEVSRKGMALQMAKMGAEINQMNANAEMQFVLARKAAGVDTQKVAAEIPNIKASTAKTEAETETTNQLRDAIKSELIERGTSEWLDNVMKQYKMEHSKDEPDHFRIEMFGHHLYGSVGVSPDTMAVQETAVGIAKAMADTGNATAQALLTNEKAKGYWTELLNATIHAEADKVKAAAIKLSTEWDTGEYTNWKTWVELGVKAANTIVGGVGAGGKLAGAKKVINIIKKE